MNKRILIIITEGETDEEFYKSILAEIKKIKNEVFFNFNEIKYICSKSITKIHKKMLGKFKKEICSKKYNEYEKVVCFCYDSDVFETELNVNPPINRKKLREDFKNAGADKIIEIVASKTIEDFFLYDIEGIKKYLKLGKNYKIPKEKSGLKILNKMFNDADKVYYKGEKVKDFINSLDKKKILKNICQQIRVLCVELGCEAKCVKCYKGNN